MLRSFVYILFPTNKYEVPSRLSLAYTTRQDIKLSAKYKPTL